MLAQQQPQVQLDAAKVALNGDPTTPTTRPAGALDTAKAALTTALGQPATTSTDDLRATCKALETELDNAGAPADANQAAEAKACRDFLNAADDYDSAVAALTWSQAWFDSRQGVSDGQLLFELNYARCHTKGWSVFDRTRTNPWCGSARS